MRLAFVQVGVSLFPLKFALRGSVFLRRLVSACIWFPQYMKNLEFEADKANEHLEEKLLPKDMIDRSKEDECPEQSSEKVVKPDASQDEVKEEEKVSARERKTKKKVSIKEPNEDDENVDDEPAEIEEKLEDKVEDSEGPQISTDESKKDK